MPRLWVDLHLPRGEGLFFVYYAADFEVAWLGRAEEKTVGRSHIDIPKL